MRSCLCLLNYIESIRCSDGIKSTPSSARRLKPGFASRLHGTALEPGPIRRFSGFSLYSRLVMPCPGWPLCCALYTSCDVAPVRVSPAVTGSAQGMSSSVYFFPIVGFCSGACAARKAPMPWSSVFIFCSSGETSKSVSEGFIFQACLVIHNTRGRGTYYPRRSGC
jgi:hypothetical protein